MCELGRSTESLLTWRSSLACPSTKCGIPFSVDSIIFFKLLPSPSSSVPIREIRGQDSGCWIFLFFAFLAIFALFARGHNEALNIVGVLGGNLGGLLPFLLYNKGLSWGVSCWVTARNNEFNFFKQRSFQSLDPALPEQDRFASRMKGNVWPQKAQNTQNS